MWEHYTLQPGAIYVSAVTYYADEGCYGWTSGKFGQAVYAMCDTNIDQQFIFYSVTNDAALPKVFPCPTGNTCGAYKNTSASVDLYLSPTPPLLPDDPSDGGGCPNDCGCTGTDLPDIPISPPANPGPFVSADQGSLPIGMPVWSVSEPQISLWLHDEPLGYQPALGPRVSLQLAYKQREVMAGIGEAFGFGAKWNSSWFSFITPDSKGSNVVHFPGGRERTFYGHSDYLSHTTLSGDSTNGFTISYPDGSQDLYTFIVSNAAGTFQAFLTQRRDPQGRGIVLNYLTHDASQSSSVLLKNVVDADGNATWIYYVTNSGIIQPQISRVVDPFGRTASFAYDQNGCLTNITDVAGLSTSFSYDTNSWVTSMTTPYGTTTFTITDTPQTGTLAPPNGRSVLVTQPDGGHHLYLYEDSAPGVPSSYASGSLPNTAPFSNTLDETSLDVRNSFYWGPAQYGALSTTNVSSLTNSDFRLARMKHWLIATPFLLGSTVSLERLPSPDTQASQEGQKTWYDYAGKPTQQYEGAEFFPLFSAQVLPNGSTRFTRTDRNTNGLATIQIATYSPGGSIALRTNSFVYANNNIDLLSATNAALLLTSSNIYNSYHQIVTNYNALGELTTFTYNTNHQLTSTMLPSGLVTTDLYFTSGSSSNRLSQTVDYAVVGGSTVYYGTNSFTWTNGLVFAHTDPLGLVVTNTWDNLQRLRRIDFPDGTSITNSFQNLDLVQTVDRMGFSNSFSYDAVRRLVAATNANGAVTRYGYCTCGVLEAVTNGFGTLLQAVTTYAWDLQGHLLQTVGPDQYIVTHQYNALGQQTNVTDGLMSTTNWFNNQGLLVASSNAFGRVSAAIYDALDRITNSTDLNGVVVTQAFDNLNRLLSRGYPDGGVERFAYTLNVSGPTAYTNQLGSNVVNFAFDPLGRKISEINPGLATNGFTYDAVGNLLTLTDGKGQITAWVRDQYGRATNKWDAADNLIFAYQFDPNGRLTNRWTPAKGSTAYRYDPAGNLTNIIYPVSPPISLAYDVLNRLTNMVDAVGTTRYAYTSAGLLQSEDGPWLDDTVTYAYTSQRQRQSLSLLAPNAAPWVHSYCYDTAGRLTNTASPAGAFSYAYDALRSTLPTLLTLPNGAYITNSYDPLARLLSTALRNNTNGVLNSHSYGYNLAGHRTALTNVAGDFRTYSYDLIGQLRTAVGEEASGTRRLNEQLGYAYDAAGNLNWRTNNALVEAFSVNNLNELTTESNTGTLTVEGTTTSTATNVAVNGLTANRYGDSTFALGGFVLANGNNSFTAVARDTLGRVDTNAITVYLPTNVAFAYDLNGNLLNDGTRYFAYDDENQLISVWVSNAWRSDFVYDGKMRRRIRREYAWSSSAWLQTNEVRYIYDANLVIQEREANNLPAVSYTRGPDLSGTLQGAGGIAGLLARTDHALLTTGDPGAHAYYHADGNGNITALINSSQLIVARYLYDPFGNVLSQSGPLADANVYRFSSKEIHANSGVFYYLYRWYDPTLQRWLNRDPIDEAGGVNLYSPVSNNPLKDVDPYGLADTAFCQVLKALMRQTTDPDKWAALNEILQTYCPPDGKPPLQRGGRPVLQPELWPKFNPATNRRWPCLDGSPTAPQPYTVPEMRTFCKYAPIGCVAGLGLFLGPIVLPPAAAGSGGIILVGGLAF
jgi:RHS repeat-associated protein